MMPAHDAGARAKGPISVAFTVYADFENYDKGIYAKGGRGDSGGNLGGHAVRIVGFGTSKGASGQKYG
eukprot:gene11051-14443_t